MSDPVPVKRLSQALVFAESDIQVRRAELAAAANAQKSSFYDLILPSGIEDVQSYGNTKIYWLVESLGRYIQYLQKQNILLKKSKAGSMNSTSDSGVSAAEKKHDEEMRALKLRQERIKTAKAESTAIEAKFFSDAIDEHMSSIRSTLMQAEREVRMELDDETADIVASFIAKAINHVCELELPESVYDDYVDDDFDDIMETRD